MTADHTPDSPASESPAPGSAATVGEVVIERLLHAERSRVWAALTETTELLRWFCPNPDLALAVVAEVVVGGTLTVDMGAGSYVADGVYTVVEPESELAFTWSWRHEPDTAPSHVRITLDALDETTILRLHHTDLADAADAEGHADGWERELDRLATLLAG